MKKLFIIAVFAIFFVRNSKAQYFQEVYGSRRSPEFLTDGHNAYNGGNTGHFLIGTTPVYNLPSAQYAFNVQRTDLSGNTLTGPPYFNNYYEVSDVYPPTSSPSLIISNPQSVELSDGSGYAIVAAFKNIVSTPSIGFFYTVIDPNTGTPIIMFGPTNSLGYYPSSGNYSDINVVSLIESQKNPGNLIICGYVRETSTGDYKPFAVKINKNGTIVWNQIYDVTGSSLPYDIIESPYKDPTYGLDEYLIVGEHYASGAASGRDAFILHLDDLYGNQLNPVDFYGTLNSEDVFTCITASSNPNIDPKGEGFVIGGHTNQSGNYDMWSLAIDNNRNVAWSNTYNYYNNGSTTNHDFCNDIMERINTGGLSEYYLVGYTNIGVFGAEDVVVNKINDNGSFYTLGQFSYGDLEVQRGVRIDQINGLDYDIDGLAIYGYAAFIPPNQIGGLDNHLVKAYFNGVTACKYDLQDPEQHVGPNYMYSSSNDNISNFTSYETWVQLVGTETEIQICYSTSEPSGDNARVADPNQGNYTPAGSKHSVGTLRGSNDAAEIVPNPVVSGSKTFDVNYEAASDESITVKLIDATGRLVIAHEYNVVKGQNTLGFDISTLSLAPAIYYVNIETNNGLETIRLSITK